MTTPAPDSRRTLTISIGTLTFVRKEVNGYSGLITYHMILAQGGVLSPEAVEVTQWCKCPTLYGVSSNGCGWDVTLEMIDGKLRQIAPVAPKEEWQGTRKDRQIARERSAL